MGHSNYELAFPIPFPYLSEPGIKELPLCVCVRLGVCFVHVRVAPSFTPLHLAVMNWYDLSPLHQSS